MIITQELLYSIFDKEDDDLYDFISDTTDPILLHMIAGKIGVMALKFHNTSSIIKTAT